MTPWTGPTPQEIQRPKGMEWVRVSTKVLWIFLSIMGLIVPMYLLRLIGFKRASQALVGVACRSSLWAIGLSVQVRGTPMQGAGAIVANHTSWLDIFVLNAVHRVYFVAKAEVANWPLIGMVARLVGTVFIRRKISDAPHQKETFLNRIGQGDRLLFFPEGTSTDGLQVLPFKSTLFAAFFEEGLKEKLLVQPVTVCYRAPAGRDRWFYCWWGDMEFAEHLLMILTPSTQSTVQVTFHDPLRVSDYASRKTLAAAAETAVRSGFQD